MIPTVKHVSAWSTHVPPVPPRPAEGAAFLEALSAALSARAAGPAARSAPLGPASALGASKAAKPTAAEAFASSPLAGALAKLRGKVADLLALTGLRELKPALEGIGLQALEGLGELEPETALGLLPGRLREASRGFRALAPGVESVPGRELVERMAETADRVAELVDARGGQSFDAFLQDADLRAWLVGLGASAWSSS